MIMIMYNNLFKRTNNTSPTGPWPPPLVGGFKPFQGWAAQSTAAVGMLGYRMLGKPNAGRSCSSHLHR